MRSRRNLPVLAVARPVPAAVTPGFESALPKAFASPGLSLQQILSILRAYRWPTLAIVVTISVLMAGHQLRARCGGKHAYRGHRARRPVPGRQHLPVPFRVPQPDLVRRAGFAAPAG